MNKTEMIYKTEKPQFYSYIENETNLISENIY